MKSLFYTLLIFGGAFLAYDYFGAPPGKKLVSKSLNVIQPAQPGAGKEDKTVIKEAAPEAPKPAAPEMPKAVEKAPTPAPATPAAPARPASSGPKFEPIEAVTGNWLKIPTSAFPREVKLMQDAMFKMSVGGSKIAAGAKVQVLSAENGILTLAPTATSPARAQLPIDGTDLKALLNEQYEKWKVLRTEEFKAAASRRALAQSSEPPPAESGSVDAAGKPQRDATSAYPLLVASMKRGEVTEIKPDNILRWYDPQPTQVQGKQGWAVKCECNVKTIFGLQPVEAQALVLNGKVVGWYYVGSGEEVP